MDTPLRRLQCRHLRLVDLLRDVRHHVSVFLSVVISEQGLQMIRYYNTFF
jgi:hypothetical protein